jgi:histidinol phosphatase-like enzyme
MSTVWRELLITENKLKVKNNLHPAVFIDRDGTIIDDIGYLADPEGMNGELR